MDIIAQFFACFSQKLAPARKIAPTGWHGRHVFATLPSDAKERRTRSSSGSEMQGYFPVELAEMFGVGLRFMPWKAAV